MKSDFEAEFFQGLIGLQYGQKVEDKLRSLSEKISWAEDWPKNNKSFWNAEAFMWEHKISKEKRGLIKKELEFLSEGKNLDLGCGAYSYVKSVGFDFSEKMLQLNENCVQKVVGDLEKKLPFNNEEFDSVTLIFVLNYVKSYLELLKEIKRILKGNGNLVIVLGNINDWHKQKEVNRFDFDGWQEVLKKAGFSVKANEKLGLWFFRCIK